LVSQEWGSFAPFLTRGQYGFSHTFNVVQNIVIPEAQKAVKGA
jgi:hypothetical protein